MADFNDDLYAALDAKVGVDPEQLNDMLFDAYEIAGHTGALNDKIRKAQEAAGDLEEQYPIPPIP